MELLGDEIATLASHIAAATARWLLLIAEFDEGRGWVDGGYKNCAHWLSWRCGIAPGTPEEQLLKYARAASAGQLERIVRGCRKVVSVEGGTQRQFAERELSWSFDDDGSVLLRGRLPAELGALVVRAIEAARDELGPPPSEIPDGLDVFAAEDHSSPRARNADALVALAESSLAERVSTADVYQVVVHVDADALSVSAETTGGCRLEDGQPLPGAAARRLTCDGSIVRVLEKDGKTISVGRKTRTIPPAMRRALRMRDHGCTFPGCTQRGHLDGHHLEHWADGGETELENLVQGKTDPAGAAPAAGRLPDAVERECAEAGPRNPGLAVARRSERRERRSQMERGSAGRVAAARVVRRAPRARRVRFRGNTAQSATG